MEQIKLTDREMSDLRAQLAHMEGPQRAEIVEAIAVARAHGDLSENFEYHAAKNEQGLLEARITALRAKLDRAVVVDERAGAEGRHRRLAGRDRRRLRRPDAGRDLERRRAGRRVARLAH